MAKGLPFFQRTNLRWSTVSTGFHDWCWAASNWTVSLGSILRNIWWYKDLFVSFSRVFWCIFSCMLWGFECACCESSCMSKPRYASGVCPEINLCRQVCLDWFYTDSWLFGHNDSVHYIYPPKWAVFKWMRRRVLQKGLGQQAAL